MKYIKEGRGFGVGISYKPWVTVHDFPSEGVVTRIKGSKSGRVHHFLSENELHYFYLLEGDDEVVDIREQFPLLDIELAMSCAVKAGVKYPTDRDSKFPYILTSDFMITTKNASKVRTVKMVKDLSNARVIEKFEIERRYWEAKGVDWKIVTELDIDFPKARAIGWALGAADFKIANDMQMQMIVDAILKRLEQHFTIKEFMMISKDYCETSIGALILKRLVLDKTLLIDCNSLVTSETKGVKNDKGAFNK
ncbi:MAG: TnsA endonuclease N-terminal domain-containing protein [Clostridiales bacterium]|nr:TnsA endonuclease N-terminal domain-containing protein [Clostridiales bacterium]